MTLLGGEDAPYSHKTLTWGAISPGVIRASSIRAGTITARNYNISLQNPLHVTWTAPSGRVYTNADTITIDVGNVSPEVVAILTGQSPGETLL